MTLIPKSDDSSGLADHNDLHIDKRSGVVQVGHMQRGFKLENGVAANLAILKDLVRAAKRETTPLYVAFVDFRKAFDSMFH